MLRNHKALNQQNTGQVLNMFQLSEGSKVLGQRFPYCSTFTLKVANFHDKNSYIRVSAIALVWLALNPSPTTIAPQLMW